VAGFIAPCLPTKTTTLPSGDQWLHEIKHDGFRIIARKKGAQVRLYSRPGNDLTRRFPLIVETLERLRSRSCIIDGEAVACDDNGVASFDLIRNHRAILTSEATVVRYFQERMPYGLFVPDIP
jgi:bifunctional non-homologous end joining protein LigD